MSPPLNLTRINCKRYLAYESSLDKAILVLLWSSRARALNNDYKLLWRFYSVNRLECSKRVHQAYKVS